MYNNAFNKHLLSMYHVVSAILGIWDINGNNVVVKFTFFLVFLVISAWMYVHVHMCVFACVCTWGCECVCVCMHVHVSGAGEET
jgi:hypothetical protein